MDAAALIAEAVPELLPEIEATFGEWLCVAGVTVGAKRLLRALSRSCAARRCSRTSRGCYNRRDALAAACCTARPDLLRLLIHEGGPLPFYEFKAALVASYEMGNYDLAEGSLALARPPGLRARAAKPTSRGRCTPSSVKHWCPTNGRVATWTSSAPSWRGT